MKRTQVNEILSFQTQRRKKVFILVSLIVVTFLFALSFLFIFITGNKLHYVKYNEKNNTSYKVFIKDNEFFNNDYLEKDNEYISSLIEKIEANFDYSINVEEKDNGIKTSVLEYRVGGIPVDVTSHNDTNGPFKYNDYSYKIKLSGRKQYDIVKKVIQEYSFLHDFTYAMNAKYPISDFTLDFSYPEDMRILFYDRGTLSGFETLTKEVGHLVVKSKGLILKRQGYLIAMREK